MLTILNFLFGVSGRFRRIDYWGHAFVAAAIWVVAGISSMSYMQGIGEAMKQAGPDAKIPSQFYGALIGFFVFFLVMMWMAISNMIRRFHDFGKSGWNGFWMLVPLVNIYFGVKLAFFRGVDADNIYGPSPYGPQAPKLAKPPRDQVL